jgi:hypothetical protein
VATAPLLPSLTLASVIPAGSFQELFSIILMNFGQVVAPWHMDVSAMTTEDAHCVVSRVGTSVVDKTKDSTRVVRICDGPCHATVLSKWKESGDLSISIGVGGWKADC